jgi:hypothetical protein
VCPKCQETLIRRYGFSVAKNVIRDSSCPSCEEPIAGIFGG